VLGGDPTRSTRPAAAKSASATPLKRPENGVFRPGTGFREFYFTETGDTTASSTLPGAYGGVFRLAQGSPSASHGRVSIAAVGDKEHIGFDNIAFRNGRRAARGRGRGRLPAHPAQRP
jgi:hypothetical protein